MRFSYDNAGMRLTETMEGLSLKAYWDETGKVWTVGWGHTGKEVVEGLIWTQDQCEAALESDIAWACNVVNSLVTVIINQLQFDALVDFTFNEGAKNFADSTLLALLNKGDFHGASLEFTKWVYSGGVILSGLVKRREAEGDYFLNRVS